MHPRHAVQAIDALAQADQRRQKPRRRAGVADEQLQRLLLGSARRNQAALAINRDGAVADSCGSGSTLTMKPSSCRHSTITCVSSLQSAPSRVVSPSASAARINARLVMLFEPGTVISARTGLSSGTISMRSGKGIGQISAVTWVHE